MKTFKEYLVESETFSEIELELLNENLKTELTEDEEKKVDEAIKKFIAEYKEKYKTRLGSDHEETDAPEYGEAYNMSFLKELERVRKERQVTIIDNPLSPAEKIDHTTLPKGYDGFNDPKNLKKDDVGLFGRIKKPNLLKVGML